MTDTWPALIVPEGSVPAGDTFLRQAPDTAVKGVALDQPRQSSPLVGGNLTQPLGVEGDRYAAGGGLTPHAPADAAAVAPSTWGDIGSAMLRETDVASAMAYLGRPTFPPDPNYNPINDPQFKDSPYEAYYLSRFVGSRSAAETQDIIGRINRENGDAETLNRGGLAGTVAGFGAGILSPLTLVPVGGWLKVGTSVGKAGSIALKAGEVAAMSGLAAAAQQAVLLSTRETATPAEAAFSIGAGTLLGGVLGAAGAGLSHVQLNRLGADMVQKLGELPWNGGPTAVGAAVSSSDLGEGIMKGALGAEKLMAFQDPLSRTMNSPFREARLANRALNEIPTMLEDNAQGIPTSPGGSAEYLSHEHDYALADSMDNMEKQFAQYRFGNEDAAVPRLRAGLESMLGRAPSKMSFTEFKQAVHEAMYSGDVHPVPEVAAAARDIRAKVEDPLKQEAIKVGIFPEDVKPGDDVSHVFRMWNTQAVAADRERLTQILAEDFGQRQEGAKAAAGGIAKSVEEKQFEIDQSRSNIEGEFARYAQRRNDLAAGLAAGRQEIGAAGGELRAAQGAHAKAERSASSVQRAYYRSLLGEVKAGRPRAPAQDILGFIRGKGGMRLARLDAQMGEKFQTAFASEIRDALGGKKGGGVLRADGLDPDAMLREAVDAGYLKPDADMNDLVSAIDDTLKGNPVHSRADEALVGHAANVKAIAEELDRAGIDVSKLSPDEFARLMGAPEKVKTPIMAKLSDEIQALADRFDKGTAKLEDLQRLAADLKDLAPEMAEGAKAAGEHIRASAGEMRILQRKLADLQKFTDLSGPEIRSLAEESVNTILGFSPDRAMLPKDIIAGPRGPLKERLLRIPTAKVSDFVVKDIAAVERAMTRTMSTDIALLKKFGSLDMSGEIAKINDEAARMIAANPARSAAITKAQKVAIDDLSAMRDRMRGTYRPPSNPDGILHRSVRTVMALNFVSRLGNVVASSISDPGHVIMNYGLNRVMRTAFQPLVRGLGTIKLAAKEARLANAALDLSNHARQMSINDLMDSYGRGSKFERGVQWLSDRYGHFSLMDHWNQMHKEFIGVVAQTKMLQGIERLVAGKATTKEVEYLAANSIDANMAERVGKQFAEHGGKDGEVWWANTEAWTDPQAVQAVRAALHREINRTLIAPGQDKPLWMSSELGRVIGQFHSFNIASVQRTILAGLQQRDAAALSGAVFMLGLGYLSYWVKAQINGADLSKDNFQTAALNAFDNSGLAGWIMDANNVSTKLSGGAFTLQRLLGAKEPSRYQAQDIFSMFGPTATTMEAVAAAARGLGEGKVTQSTVHQIRSLIPLQNLFYLRWLFNAAEGGINNAFGIRKKAA